MTSMSRLRSELSIERLYSMRNDSATHLKYTGELPMRARMRLMISETP